MTASDNCKKYTIKYGRKTIKYSILYTDRKTMEIAVHPDTSVFVKAPVDSDISLIGKKIFKRARWILRQQAYFDQFNPRAPDRLYINGETHLYLGRQYRLKLAQGELNTVKLSGGYLHITFRYTSTPEIAKKLLRKWYLNKANVQFKESLDRCWVKFADLGINKPKLSIRIMRTRWGSLSDNGTVTLNTNLIRAPKECIDYVVIHELCHLKYRDHSPDFYKLLQLVIPDWENRKHKLEYSLNR